MEYLLVAAGGSLGSLARFVIGRRIAEKSKTDFPVGTFVINISGAVLLGFMSSMGVNGNGYILIGDGFLGAFTTFSTFMYEGFSLFQGNEKLNAFVYVLGSLIFGIIGFVTGVEIAKFLQMI